MPSLDRSVKNTLVFPQVGLLHKSGHSRLAPNQTYVSAPDAAGRTLLTAYLPSRTALVLQKIK